MIKNRVLITIIGALYIFNLSAAPKIDGAETVELSGACNKLCTAQGKDAYQNTISTRISSVFIDPQETYQGSNKYVCIPCECGDGEKQEHEACDDGNNKGLDGCTADCGTVEYCGDEIVNTPLETCDKGGYNGTSGSLCNKDCKIDICLGFPEEIAALCGNRFTECDEECDAGDNNGLVGSGCTRKCIIDKCLRLPEQVKLLCGNGTKECDEECDAGSANGTPGTNCNKECKIDKCFDTAENVKLLCGNGTIDCDEECDDENSTDGDGCSKECKKEQCDYNVVTYNPSQTEIFKGTAYDKLSCLKSILTSCSNNQAAAGDVIAWHAGLGWGGIAGGITEADGRFNKRATGMSGGLSSAWYIDDCAATTLIRTVTDGQVQTAWAQQNIQGGWPAAYFYNAYVQMKTLGFDTNAVYEASTGYDGYGVVTHMTTNYVIDSNCKLVTTAVDSSKVCGSLSYSFLSSPISLLWNEKADVNEKVTLVDFPLNMEQKAGTWYTWKASEETPLLVYDPKHTGKVDNAGMLFGNWTFANPEQGGVVPVSTNSQSKPKKWADGYQALSTLDLNKDLKISGSELKDLDLWFDRNMNGVSEKGEVVRLNELGIESISVVADPTDKETGDIYSSIGYTRKLANGEKIKLPTVDWNVPAFADKAAGINHYRFETQKKEKFIEPKELNKEAPITSSTQEHPNYKDSIFNGTWEYEFDKSAKEYQGHTGILLITAYEGNALTGVSMQELSLKDNNSKAKSIIQQNYLAGLILDEKTNKAEFITGSKDSGQILNEVTIDEKGIMHGVSKTHVRGIGKENQKTELQFNWTAKRVASGIAK